MTGKAETPRPGGGVVAALVGDGRVRGSDPEPVEPAPAPEPPPPRDRTRRVALIVAILCVATLVGGGTAAFANDAFARAHMLPGTRIGGIYVGGKPLAEAAQKVTSAFVAPPHQPKVGSA